MKVFLVTFAFLLYSTTLMVVADTIAQEDGQDRGPKPEHKQGGQDRGPKPEHKQGGQDRGPKPEHKQGQGRGEKPRDKRSKGTGVRRLTGKGQKLRHVQTGKCVDFESGRFPTGDLVSCDTTTTRFDEKKSSGKAGFKTYEIVSGLQAGKCLDSWSDGSYECDGTTWQKWDKTKVGKAGSPRYTLQDQKYFKFLDDWNDAYLEMDDENPGCTCQEWQFI